MALHTVSIEEGAAVEVYGGYDAAVVYMNNRIGSAYAAWRALDADDRKRTLVNATSYLDALEWTGEANGLDDTELEWPRDDVYWSDGETLYTDAEQLAIVERATFELAALLAADPDMLQAPTAGGGPQIASVSAGGASVSYFESGDAESTTLPTAVDRLLGRFLVGYGSLPDDAPAGGMGVSGDSVSGFSETGDYDRTKAF